MIMTILLNKKSFYSFLILFFMFLIISFSNLGLAFNETCEKTYTYEIRGNLNDSTSILVKEYILSRKGICNVQIDLLKKTIIVEFNKNIDEEIIKSVIIMAYNNFRLKGEHIDAFSK